jgi:hypothetical protein
MYVSGYVEMPGSLKSPFGLFLWNKQNQIDFAHPKIACCATRVPF